MKEVLKELWISRKRFKELEEKCKRLEQIQDTQNNYLNRIDRIERIMRNARDGKVTYVKKIDLVSASMTILWMSYITFIWII